VLAAQAHAVAAGTHHAVAALAGVARQVTLPFTGVDLLRWLLIAGLLLSSGVALHIVARATE
jgi:hypothetical protein